MQRLFKNKDGYVLAWVVCILVVVSLISAVTLSFADMSAASTAAQHNYRQAYYTAKSAAAALAKYIADHASDSGLLEDLMDRPGTGTTDNMGDYTVDVSYASADKIKIASTAVFRDQEASVTVYLVKSEAGYDVVPTEQIVYINGSAGTGFVEGKLYGNIYIDGNVSISGSDLISGDVWIKGDLNMNGSARIEGNVKADGSLYMYNGEITGEALIGSDVYFTGGSKLRGKLYYAGAATTGWGNLGSFALDGYEKISSYTPIANTQAIPDISVPSRTQLPELYQTLTIENSKISDSGILSASAVSKLNSMPYGSTLTIDASSKNIYLLLDNTMFFLTNGLKIKIKGDGSHNVIIYMTGTSSFFADTNQYIGMLDTTIKSRLFILGDGQQTVNLSNCELNACVYLPYGTFKAYNSALNTYIFIGTCTAKNISISSGVKLLFSKPDISDTPLSSLEAGGGTGSGGSGWTIESWDSR